jgi:hypothetical protein
VMIWLQLALNLWSILKQWAPTSEKALHYKDQLVDAVCSKNLMK